jgi:hypothetical protein
MIEATSLATFLGIAAGLGVSVLVCAPAGDRPRGHRAVLPPPASSSCHRLPLLAGLVPSRVSPAVRGPFRARRGSVVS